MDGQEGFYGEFIPSETDCYPEQECRLPRQFFDIHHIYFEEVMYQTRIEQKFRDLGENLIRGCRCRHIELHEEIDPPEKPPVEYMIWRINESDEHISVRLRKEMDQYE